jgi:hypothetical protein
LSDSHDFKASIILGTSGIVIALLLTALPLAQSQLASLLELMVYKTVVLTIIGISLLVLFASIILSVIVLWIKNYDRPPCLDRLREHYIIEQKEETQLQLIDVFIPAIVNNEKILKRQANLIRTAAILLSIGLLTFIGLLSWFIMIFLKIIIL